MPDIHEVQGKLNESAFKALTSHTHNGVVDPKFVSDLIEGNIQLAAQAARILLSQGNVSAAQEIDAQNSWASSHKNIIAQNLKNPGEAAKYITGGSAFMVGNMQRLSQYNEALIQHGQKPEKLTVPDYMQEGIKKNNLDLDKLKQQFNIKEQINLKDSALLENLNKQGLILKDTSAVTSNTTFNAGQQKSGLSVS